MWAKQNQDLQPQWQKNELMGGTVLRVTCESPQSQQTASLKLRERSNNTSWYQSVVMDKSIPLVFFYDAFFSFNLWFYFYCSWKTPGTLIYCLTAVIARLKIFLFQQEEQNFFSLTSKDSGWMYCRLLCKSSKVLFGILHEKDRC